MAAIFNLDKRQVHRVLVNNLQALQEVLQSKIQWPTDTEFQQYLNQFQGYLNGNFRGPVCVVDGTEIRVSRPSNETKQKDLYSKKKKPFAINVRIICLLNGKIMYVSKHRKGAYEQSHWKELDF
jgi:RNAse (barnase) inhibitor barstar